jgi:hypothetical protein
LPGGATHTTHNNTNNAIEDNFWPFWLVVTLAISKATTTTRMTMMMIIVVLNKTAAKVN